MNAIINAIPDSIVIVLAVFGFPAAIGGLLYSMEATAIKVREFRQRRAVNKRLNNIMGGQE